MFRQVGFFSAKIEFIFMYFKELADVNYKS